MATTRRSPRTRQRASSPAGRRVKVGLTQMACGPNANANLTRQLALAGRAVADGAQIICTQELFRSQYFCQSEDHACFGLAETIPGPSTDAFQQFAEEARRRRRRLALREARRRALPQHRGHHRRRRIAARHLPQDAHPRRSALLREVLLHAGRHRLPGVEDEVRHDRRADLLGPVVSRRRRASRRCRAPRSSSTRRPSAGIRRRRSSTARRSTSRGK